MEPTSDKSDMLSQFKDYYKEQADYFGFTFVGGTAAGAVFHSIAGFRKADGALSNKLKQSLMTVGRRAPVWGGLLSAANMVETVFTTPYNYVMKKEEATPAIFALSLAAFNHRGGPAKMLGYGVMGSAIAYAILAVEKKFKIWDKELDRTEPIDIATN